MKIVLFSFLGVNIYSHGFFLVLSMIIGGLLFFRFLKKEKIETNRFLSNYIIAILSGVFFSRIFYYLFNINSYKSPFEIVLVWQGGLVSFAGFIVGTITYMWLLKKQGSDIIKSAQISGIVFPIAIAIGRVGCVLNGEFGSKTDSIFAFYGVMPIPILEIYLCLVIFSINLYLYNSQKNIARYLLPYIFVSLYSVGRIFIDYWRIDEKLIIGINISQLTSLIIFFLATIIYFFYNLGKEKNDRQ